MKKFYVLFLATLTIYLTTSARSTLVWKHFKGVIYLQNNDSLKGDILFYPIGSSGLIYRTNFMGFSSDTSLKSDTRKVIKWLRFKNIKKVTIFSVDQSSPVSYAFFNRKMWLLLKEKNSLSIYSNDIDPNSKIESAPVKMILISNTKIFKMYSYLSWLFSNRKTKSRLLKFINTRYNTAYHDTDFANEYTELDYILNHG